MAQNPRVGVAALILRKKDDQLTFLMGKRKGSHGASTWAPPGGHLEHGEEFFTCAERETLEETGLAVKGKKLVAVTNDLIPAGQETKHYVTMYVFCEVDDNATPQIMEPNKCEKWEWVAWSQVRDQAKNLHGKDGEEPAMPLFLPIVNLLRDYPELEKSLHEMYMHK